MNKFKILFVGDTSYDMYVSAFYNAALNISEIQADIMDFGKLNTNTSQNRVLYRIERHYNKGPHIIRFNRRLIKAVKDNKYDIVFLYSCDIVKAQTVKIISSHCYVAVYNNDNPFSLCFSGYKWKETIKSLPYANMVYSYRVSNMTQYKDNGAKCVKLMRSYYIKERNYYIDDKDIDLEVPNVCFIGHYEDDERIDYINELAAVGIDIGVGDYWRNLSIESPHIVYIENGHINYNEILNKTKIALVFLSKINEDTYTRRCFEIPAVKTLMIAPYNEDMASLYIEDKEAVYFRDKKEFVNKVKYYLEHEAERQRIAEAGYERLMKDGNEAADRVSEIVRDYRDALGK